MSTIKSSDEHLTLNADGSSKDIKFQANGVEKASISSSGAFTSTTIDATKLTGTIPNFTSTGIDDNATSTAITIDASENVGIGTTPETNTLGKALHLGQSANIVGASSSDDFWINNNCYYNSGWKYTNTNEACRVELDQNGKTRFFTAPSGSADAAISWTTAMTIDNDGDIEWGTFSTTGATAGKYINTGTNALEMQSSCNTASARNHFSFYNTNGIVGNIRTSDSATSFVTSSDYRLKENVDYTWDATTRLKQLKPARFNFIADDTTTVDGFIAHEVSDIVPEAISGEKDAMKDEEYEVTPAVMDGDTVVTPAVMGTRSVPDYQGIDQSKLVPLLVKTIQELEARITALEA